MEEWYEIKGFPNYMISDSGKVKSLANDRMKKEKILKLNKGKVQLYSNGVRFIKSISRLKYERDRMFHL